jgi:hypothetical protein
MGCDALEDGRGVAVADFNSDGRLDVVISNNNGRPTIYVNNQARVGNWLRIDLAGSGPGGSRDPLGARVDVVVDCPGGPRTMTRWVEAGAGYASQSEFTLHFGLGEARAVESLSVRWPGRPTRQFTKEELGEVSNRTLSIDGAGARVRRAPARDLASARTQRPGRGR